ncbi:alpha/beta hydrolase [Sphingomonas panacisoli]|uniref:Alpha/beta hydrolase n=1 Tax=Sphingomonas panacisoli TaxID=1813879 RepID=A0A5B8LFF7_9SPHN|nr:alpha/beta hydrolase [Sphingomonas panacisoli]QDZ06599.1 alpha/beta hydrolase [Sphingomonas panacisoli]
MKYIPLRIAAACLTPLLVLNPDHAHAAPAATSAEVRMDHISVVTMGKGSPVILIPGLSSPRSVWDGVASDLAKTHRVVLIQVNGFAGDDAGANLKAGVLDGIVTDVDAYIAKNKLSGAAVIGHSMGGLVGLMLAKAHPADVGKLMIVDSLPWFGMLFGPTATVPAVEPRAKAMRDQMAASYGKPDAANAQGTAKALALKPESQAKVVDYVMKADPRVSAEAMYEDMTTDLRGDLAKIETPITLLYPSSAGLPAAMADPFYKGAYAAAPHVTYQRIDDSAHFIMLDQPEVFAKAVMAFVG